jgi:SAM-dependent methyltransferase
MHPAALQWLDACRARLSVCDLGSLNVNGSARDHFHGWDYVGVDCRPGPGVTVVADAREYDADGREFDVVVSCEMLEHCPDWPRAIVNAYCLTKPGGAFWGTAAGPKRPVHSSDGSATLGEKEHYANVDPDDLKWRLECAGFDQIVVRLASDGNDVQWFARRPVE